MAGKPTVRLPAVEAELRHMDFPFIRYFDAAREVTERLCERLRGDPSVMIPAVAETLDMPWGAEIASSCMSIALIPSLQYEPNPETLKKVAAVFNEFIMEEIQPKKKSQNEQRPVYRGGAVRLLRLERDNVAPEKALGRKTTPQLSVNEMKDKCVPGQSNSPSPFVEKSSQSIRWKLSEGGVHKDGDRTILGGPDGTRMGFNVAAID